MTIPKTAHNSNNVIHPLPKNAFDPEFQNSTPLVSQHPAASHCTTHACRIHPSDSRLFYCEGGFFTIPPGNPKAISPCLPSFDTIVQSP